MRRPSPGYSSSDFLAFLARGALSVFAGLAFAAFSAFGVSVEGAVVAVLAYRAFSFWLPTLPGAVAYFQLRHTVRAWDTNDSAVAAAVTP